MEAAGIDPSVMIDCSHANSGKDYRNQPDVSAEVGLQIAKGNTSIRSVMIESHLTEGAQKMNSNLSKLKYGVSVTDSCVGWDTTYEMVMQLAADVRKRRAIISP
jgi:3-deoxy-7-phosphoheptulonate synthase